MCACKRDLCKREPFLENNSLHLQSKRLIKHRVQCLLDDNSLLLSRARVIRNEIDLDIGIGQSVRVHGKQIQARDDGHLEAELCRGLV